MRGGALKRDCEKSEIPHNFGSVKDENKRQGVEDALYWSEDRYRNLVESTGVGIAATDWRGRFTFVNDALCAMIGYSRKELVGKHFADFLHPEDRKGVLKIFFGAWKHPTLKPKLEFRVIHKKGHVVHMYSTPTLFMHKNRIVGFNAIITDISERKLMERDLRSSGEKFRDIFENAYDCLIYLDRFGKILDVNQKAVETFGGSKKELLGKRFTKVSVLSPTDLPRLATAFAKGLAGGNPMLSLRIKNKKGQVFFLECSGSLVKTDNKLTTLVIARDVTERKRVEKAIRESQQKFERLFMNNPEAAFYADTEWRILDINPRFTELFGYTLEEVRSKESAEVIVPKDKLEEAGMLGMKAREGYTYYDTVRMRKDGSLVPVSISAGPIIVDGQLVGYVTLYKDMTQHKRAEETLRESEEKYRNLFENARDVILTVDLFGNVTSINKAIDEYGWKREEIIGKNMLELMPKEAWPSLLLGMTQMTEGRLLEGEMELATPKGRRIVEYKSNPITKDGKIIGVQVIGRDVTETKKIQGKVRESEERYRNLFENASDVIVTFDLKGNVTSVNNAVTKYGFDRDEMIGNNLSLFVHEKNRLKLAEEVAYILKGNLVTGETEIITTNGVRIAEYRSNPLMLGNEIVGIQSIYRDVTERREMEERVRDSEEKLRAITASATDAILLIDNEGKFSYWNPAAQKMFGYTEEEVKNKKMYDFIAPKRFNEDHLRGFKRFQKTGMGPNIGKTVETTALRKDNTEFPVEFSLSALQVKGKRYALGIVRDITERKKMEERLKQYSEHLEESVQKRTEELLESEIRYSILVEEAGDGVGIVQDGKIVFANKKCAEILDYSVDEGIGRSFLEMIDEKHRKFIKERYTQRIRGKKAPTTYETLLLSKTGKKVPVEITATLIQYQGQPADLVIIRDLRERKQIEEQRLKLEKLAAIGELATMVAHDLRNPLTSIRNASFYIKNSCPVHANTECKSACEMLDIIEQETLFANNIINDLLDFAVKKPLQTSRQNINTVIEDSLTKSKTPKKVEIEKKFAENSIAVVDEKQLERVFLNITKNAVQAMPSGGKLTITTNETKNYIEIIFADTGTGIPPENISKLFLPLFTTKAKGIGMGLAICKRIVEEHHGTIDVESEVGKGTSFTIKLPKEETDNQ